MNDTEGDDAIRVVHVIKQFNFASKVKRNFDGDKPVYEGQKEFDKEECYGESITDSQVKQLLKSGQKLVEQYKGQYQISPNGKKVRGGKGKLIVYKFFKWACSESAIFWFTEYG